MSATTLILRAFHGDPAIKAKYQARLAEHRRLEHLTQGIGWESSKDGTKGCAVGCTLEVYDHSRYPVELGLPVWVAHLQDTLFEGLPKGKAEKFAEDFIAAIPVGADVEPVRQRLAIARMNLLLARLDSNEAAYAEQTRSALQQVRAWHEAALAGAASESERRAAWSAAWSAAESAAESAAWSAAESAWSAAWSAAESAWSAWSAAESAAESARSARSAESAESAESAAWSARSAHYEWEASTLLALLRAA